MLTTIDKIPILRSIHKVYLNYQKISDFVARLDKFEERFNKVDDRINKLEERMTKIENIQNDPAYHCTFCKTDTRVLLDTHIVEGQLTGIYYCMVCERVSEREASEKVTTQNAQTVEIISKLKEQGYIFDDILRKQKPINRGSSSGWDVYG